MFHFAAHEIRWHALYADAEEALRLWSILTARLPGAIALCVMPNHIHALHPSADPTALLTALRAYARFRNARRGEPGRAVWAPFDAPEPIAHGKTRTQIRYVHLNPCRARLVPDPLAWPLSTRRDAVGLAPHPVRSAERGPRSFHAYVSGDPTVTPEGTSLPSQGYGLFHPERVADVVSGLYRVPRAALRHRSEARSIWIGASRALSGWTPESSPRTARLDDAPCSGLRAWTTCGCRGSPGSHTTIASSRSKTSCSAPSGGRHRRRVAHPARDRAVEWHPRELSQR